MTDECKRPDDEQPDCESCESKDECDDLKKKLTSEILPGIILKLLTEKAKVVKLDDLTQQIVGDLTQQIVEDDLSGKGLDKVPLGTPQGDALEGWMDKVIADNMGVDVKIDSVRTPSVTDEWKPLFQHFAYAVAFKLRTRDTLIKFCMSPAGQVHMDIKRGGELVHRVEIEREPESKNPVELEMQ